MSAGWVGGVGGVPEAEGVWRGIRVQGSCLSLTICLRFLWSGFSGEMEEKGRETALAWLLARGFWCPVGVHAQFRTPESFKKQTPAVPAAPASQEPPTLSQKVPERGFLLTFPERTRAACWPAWCRSCLYWFLQGKRNSEWHGEEDQVTCHTARLLRMAPRLGALPLVLATCVPSVPQGGPDSG